MPAVDLAPRVVRPAMRAAERGRAPGDPQEDRKRQEAPVNRAVRRGGEIHQPSGGHRTAKGSDRAAGLRYAHRRAFR